MKFPENDNSFEDKPIDRVEGKNGKFLITCDGWSLHCGDECPIEPKQGDIARMYGKGFGYPVRGLFINGTKIWYRTEDEEKEHREIQSYGADAKDWLSRWDEGKTVWTFEMGGLGPGYEQCIHITAAEILRWLIANNADCDAWDDKEKWSADSEKIQQAMFKNSTVNDLGLSGAQYGAALSVATALYAQGPRKLMSDEKMKDRHIQVSKHFPGSKAA